MELTHTMVNYYNMFPCYSVFSSNQPAFYNCQVAEKYTLSPFNRSSHSITYKYTHPHRLLFDKLDLPLPADLEGEGALVMTRVWVVDSQVADQITLVCEHTLALVARVRLLFRRLRHIVGIVVKVLMTTEQLLLPVTCLILL